MHVPIKRSIERFPGGMMAVPLLLGAVLATAFPGAPDFFGSFTQGLFTGAIPLLAVFYVCLGSTIRVDQAGEILRTGGVLFGTKIVFSIVVGIVLGQVLGETPVESGLFAGLSTLAVVAALNDTNGGLYMALMRQYGRRSDVAGYSVMSIESGPFLTMVTLGAAGLSAFPWQTLIGAVIPLLIGVLLGTLDPDLRDFLGPAADVIIPFFAFALGAGIDLTDVWSAGLLGVALGAFVVIVGGTILFTVNRLTGGTGLAGLAAATTAGNAAAVPAIVAAANPDYRAAAAQATVLVAASLVVTSIVTPLLVGWLARSRGMTPDDQPAAGDSDGGGGGPSEAHRVAPGARRGSVAVLSRRAEP